MPSGPRFTVTRLLRALVVALVAGSLLAPHAASRAPEATPGSSPAPARQAEPATSMFRGNAERSGLTGGSLPQGALVEQWRFAPPGRAMGMPALAGDTIYVTMQGEKADAGLSALDAATGEPRWTTEMAIDDGGAPAVAGGLVYVAGGGNIGQHGLAAIDAATGERRWWAETEARITVPPVAAGGTVVVADESPSLYGVDSATGERRWQVALPDYAGPPALAGNLVYVESGGVLYALDAATGAEAWTRRRAPGAGIVAIAGGVLYTASGGLIALDTATGAERWRTPLGGLHVFIDEPVETPRQVLDGPAVTSATIYTLSQDDRFTPIDLHAVDARTGLERWRVPVGFTGFGTIEDAKPIVTGSGAEIVIGARQDREGAMGVLVLDAVTGHIRAWHPVDGSLRHDPVIGDAMLYAVAGDGETTALLAYAGDGTAPEPAPWPLGTPAAVGAGTLLRGNVETYTSPTHGVTLTYAEPWTRFSETTQNGIDTVILDTLPSEAHAGRAILEFAADPTGDTGACVSAAYDAFEAAESVSEMTPINDAWGAPLQGGDDLRTYTAFSFVSTAAGQEPRHLFQYLECRALGNGVMLHLRYNTLTPPDATLYRIPTLLAGLALPAS